MLAVAGMSYKELGERYDMEPGTIAVMAHRKEWAVPARVEKLRNELAANRKDPTNPTGEVGNVRESNVGVQMAESIAEIGQKGQISALRGMLPRFLKTFEQDSELLQKPVEDWKTAGSMVNIFSKLAGLDKPQTLIQQNVWGDGWGAQGAVPVDGESVDDGDELP